MQKDKRGIQVYTGAVTDSPHRAVFSTMEIEATPRAVVGLLLDFPNCRLWASMCKEARIEQQISSTESIVYGLNDLPFPARDRDSYSRVQWHVDTSTGVVQMHSEALNDQNYSVKKGVIRLTFAHASWRIVPLPSTPSKPRRVLVENYIHIDPNGQLPPWLSNKLAVDAPYKAMRKMRALLKTGKYDNVDIAFLPPHSNSKHSENNYD